MSLYVIARVTKYNNKWIRLFSDVDNKIQDIKEKDLIFILRGNGCKIQNAELQDNKLVGTTGSIDKILDKNCFVVLGKVEDKYKLVNMKGETKLFTIPEVKKLTNKGILQNAKLVEKDGKEFISGIGWEIPEIEEKKEVKKVSKKKRYSDKECEELLKNFALEIKELHTSCGKPCYLSSKSDTEHLLWIPSNVTELNNPDNDWPEDNFTLQIQKLKGSLKVIGGSGLVSCYEMFDGCKSLNELDLSSFDTYNVEDMGWMFQSCGNLEKLDLSNFDTHNVTNMNGMFYNCKSLKELDVSNFDTYNVITMWRMFDECESLEKLDLSNFDTHNVKDMSYMFKNCESLKELNLSSFDTHNVTDMESMFYDCRSLKELDLSSFDTHNVTNMSHMYSYCKSLKELDVSNFDTSNVTTMKVMFSGCKSLEKLDLSNFDTHNVKKMDSMFDNCKSLKKLDLSNFDTSNVIRMEYMFSGCESLRSVNSKESQILKEFNNR